MVEVLELSKNIYVRGVHDNFLNQDSQDLRILRIETGT